MNKFDEKIRASIETEDYTTIGEIADMLRFGWHMTHKEIFERFKQAHPELTFPEFDEIMAEVDNLKTWE